MTSGNDFPQHFKLNLTGISKTPTTTHPPPADEPSEAVPRPARPIGSLLNAELKKGGTVQPPGRPSSDSPVRQSTTLARKNLVIKSESSSEDDLGLELIPVGQDDPEDKANVIPDVIEAPAIAVTQLPDLNVGDDDDEGQEIGEAGKLSLLRDMLLTVELADEPPDTWSYRRFIHQFAQSEASHDIPDGANEGEDDYSVEDDDLDEYDSTRGFE
jgi:hypothetical protein